MKLWKFAMIFADVKVVLKQQETKELIAVAI